MQPELKKRRSTRIVQAVPLAVSGVDALGRPFQERTSTLIINCHGARYQSKHYVLKNMWVTLEIPHPEAGLPPRSVRGKVTWIQRPRTVRQLFQIAVELEMPGNFWGIAFPPEDWFPAFSSHTGAPTGLTQNELPAARPHHEPGQFPTDNLHVMLAPVAATPESSREASSSHEASPDYAELAREMKRLIDEAHCDVQTAAREAVSQAVSAETGPLLADLQARFRKAETEAETAAQTAAMIAAERGAEVAAAKLSAAQAAAFDALRAELPKAIAPHVEEATQRLSAELEKAGTARFAAFDEKLQSALNAAHGTIEQLSRETTACLEKLQGSLQHFESEADRRAEAAHSRWEQSSREHWKQSSASRAEAAEADQRLHDELSTATSDTANDWRVRLEADIALASSRWEQTIETSMEAAANRAAEQIEQRRRSSADQLEHEWSSRAEQFRNSIEATTQAAASRAAQDLAERRQAAAEQMDREWNERAEQIRKTIESKVGETESQLSSLRDEFERQTARAYSSLGELQEASKRAQEFAGHLEGLRQLAIEQAQSRLNNLVSSEAEKFAQQAENVMESAARRIEPLLETAGRESVERISSECEARISSQLKRTAEVLDKLAAAEKLPEGLLRIHQEHLERISEQSRNRAVARLEEDLTAVEKEFQQKVQTTQNSWLEELEKRASEVQAAASDSLFKTAEWQQKHAESRAQAAFETRIEEASVHLREKAGELSGRFAAELDHYSRSYVEHSQTQMDEAVKETFERARGLFSEVADTTIAAFTDEIQRGAHGELATFQESLEKTSAESRTQMETEAQQIKDGLRAEGNESFAEFQTRMAAAIETGVVHAGQQLEKQLEPVMQTWRELTGKQNQQIQETYERLGNESLENYKSRLENVSNSWMLATVTTLDRQAQELISGVAKSAEERLRDTCSQVFAGVGDNLRARLQEIAVSLASAPLARDK